MPPRPFVILLIEDDHLDAHLFGELCREYSPALDVHVQGNGREALAYLERGHTGDLAAPRPDLIVLDLKMPIMDGHQFLQEARRRDHFRIIPTLVLSVSDSEDDVSRSYRHAANGYLVKPDTLAEFKELVRVVVSYWRGAVRLPRLDDL